jgi:hypothetical protein
MIGRAAPWIFAALCSGPLIHGQPVKGPGQPAQPAQALALKTDGGLRAAGIRLSSLVKDRAGTKPQDRIATGWGLSSNWMEPLGRGISEGWPSCVLLGDLGASAKTEEEAYAQMDPESFAALLWIEPLVAADKGVSALDVVLHPARGKPPVRFRFECAPPLRGPAPPPVPEFRIWKGLDLPVRALAWEEAQDRLWAATEARLERLDPATGKTEQGWDFPAAREGAAPGPAVLSFLMEEPRPPRVGWFDLGRGSGRWFERGKEGYAPGPELASLPLSDRMLKFLTPSYEGVGTGFLLTSYQGNELCQCLAVVRFQGPDGTCIGCLTPHGKTKIVRGDKLAVMDGPPADVAAIAASGRLFFAASASAPFTVKGYALLSGYTWETVWTSPLLPAAPTSLCAGSLGGQPVLYAAIGRDISLCDLPKGDPLTGSGLP